MKRVGAVGLAIAGALAVSHAIAAEDDPAVGQPAAPASAAAGDAGALPAMLRPLARADLDVTLGELEAADGRLLVESPKFRAVARRLTHQVAELDFTFLGPTRTAAPLASGELRRQLGFKLRAADGCNLVYVMWRLAPRQQLVVSVKRNAGARLHVQCGAGGYRNVRARHTAPLPRVESGGSHQLRARLDGDRLIVHVDGVSVWEGRLGAEILAFDGPVGLRTDNARVAFQLRLP